MGKTLLACFLLLACDGDAADDPADAAPAPDGATQVADAAPDATPDAAPPDAALVDLTEAVFEPARLLQIDIELPPDDWDTLRHQTRSLYDVLGPDCLDAPAERPFTWFEATVTIDGERVERVGFRKKGFIGSLSATRPSLKVKFDEYRDDVRWSGMRRLTLNNNRQDPAHVRQCLGYAVFAAAGVPSPRCNFARVTVNGTDLGVYSHVESVKSPFLERAFGSKDGNLYEGQLSDFRPGWTGTFQLKRGTPGMEDIDAVVEALEGPDERLLARLAPWVDLDAFLTFWAAETIVGHWDGYAGNTNNFYIYADPANDGTLRFIPWGIDGIMRTDDRRALVLATGALAWRLYRLRGFAEAFVESVNSTLDAAWDAEHLLAEVDRMEAMLAPHALQPDRMRDALVEVREFIAERGLQLSLALAVPPRVPPELRGPLCMRETGPVEADFETTWGTFPDAPPTRTGASRFETPVQGEGGATIGIGVEGDERGNVVLLLIAPTHDGIIGLHTLFSPDQLRPGVVRLDGSSARTVAFRARDGGQPQPIGFMNGTLTLDAASDEPGAPVSGSFEGVLLEFGR